MSKYTYVRSLAAAPVTDEHGDSLHVAHVHRSDVLGVAVQRIAGGGRIEGHHHREMWDHFVGLSGQGTIRADIAGHGVESFAITPGAFLAIPPGSTHEVINVRRDAAFEFLLFQAPWTDDDIVFDEHDGVQI